MRRYAACPEVCRRLDNPGLAIDMPIWVDHTRDETTVDQARIEHALEGLGAVDRNLLHVGVGNSGFALRFAPVAHVVDGLTVSPAEKDLADSLGIANYTVYLLSKYSRELVLTLQHRYDFVVDNNLASFACCTFHFFRMLDSYVWCLRPGGRILTDQRGMDFTVEDDPRWRLTFDDLVGLGELFPLSAERITDTVYALRLAP
ncbi:MAG: hypothetical protein ACRD12_07800 [Acidimicrobiales bacterium]